MSMHFTLVLSFQFHDFISLQNLCKIYILLQYYTHHIYYFSISVSLHLHIHIHIDSKIISVFVEVM